MNIQQVMIEVGRLHMENLALRAENEELKAVLTAMAGPAAASLDQGESESESDPRDPSGPSDGTPEQDG